MITLTTQGKDSLGRFETRTPAVCDICNEFVDVATRYRGTLKLPDGVAIEATIMKRGRPWVGLSCGCYGKLHRQLGHIVTSMERRSRGN